MIISHKHKFVFLHNPKVAGSAIRKAMEHLHDDETVYWHQKFFPQLDRVVDAAHLTFHDFKLVQPNLVDQGYTFFTVIRNPYKRFVSGILEFGRQQEVKFESWEQVWQVIKHLTPASLRFDWKYIHLCPQHYFVPGPDAKASRYIASHENMAEGWSTWTQIIEMPDLELPKVRVRPDPENSVIGTHNIPLQVVEWINSMYYEDFKRLGSKMFGEPMKCGTHYDRVNGIHSPYLMRPAYDDCTIGEQIAYNQQFKPE